jgi:hypothetical protein
VTGVDVEHTKALEAAATPGPWLYCTKTYDGMPLVVAEGYGFPAEPMRQTRGIVCYPEADAEFIAHARTAIPALVAAVERVQALHSPWPSPSIQTYCRTCAHPMPCPTRQALEGP